MKKENISEIIGNIEEKYIEEAAMYDAPDRKIIDRRGRMRAGIARTHKTKWAIAVACAVLAISVSLGGVAYAAETKEYNDAVVFFEQNGLAVDGLSRAELKAVYRDISSRSFTYDKTASVIKRSIPGWEIEQYEPTPQEIAEIWNNGVHYDKISKTGICYRKEYKYAYDKQLGFDVFDKCVLECYKDGNLLWTADFSDFAVENCVHTSNGTAVYGYNSRWSSDQRAYGWIARVDGNGKILWEKCLDHDLKYEYVAAVIDNGDDTWAVISRGENYLCFDKFDVNGRELSGKKTDIGYRGVGKSVRFGDGYLVQLGNVNGRSRITECIAKLDGEGNLIDNFTYTEYGSDYYITDMVEFGGQIYLSAYAVPRQLTVTGIRDEISGILNYIFEKQDPDISSEELTPMVRNNYTAVLLICDPNGGAPQSFYSVKGALGGKLSIGAEGRLEWQTENIVSTFFSPATSSFTIGGTCKIIEYSFDVDGNLTSREDTGEISKYRR